MFIFHKYYLVVILIRYLHYELHTLTGNRLIKSVMYDFSNKENKIII